MLRPHVDRRRHTPVIPESVTRVIPGVTCVIRGLCAVRSSRDAGFGSIPSLYTGRGIREYPWGPSDGSPDTGTACRVSVAESLPDCFSGCTGPKPSIEMFSLVVQKSLVSDLPRWAPAGDIA